MFDAFPGTLDEVRQRRAEKAVAMRMDGRGAPKKGAGKAKTNKKKKRR